MKTCNFSSALLASVTLLIGMMASHHVAAGESGYSFSVRNNTRVKITKLLVSEDKKEWGYFDVGKGIAPGTEETMVWDLSTNNEGCDQYVKAEYADGTESEEAKFNFCEANLELEF